MRCPSDSAPLQLTVPIPGHVDATFATGNTVGCEGVLFPLSRTRLSEVTDGLSQTLFLGERLFHPDVAGTLPFTAGWCGFVSETDTYVFNSSPHVAASPVTFINRFLSTPGNFSSRHPTGVNFVLGDGSVRFVSEHIEHSLLQALGTPNGNEIVDF
jgi:prepilin-type processing-associated H-X9-DG protein